MRIIILGIVSLVVLTVSAAARNGVPLYASPDAAALSAPVHQGENILNTYQSERLAAYLAGTSAPLDTLRLLAIQVQFADSLFGGPGSHRPELRDSLFFSNELKHLREYYRGASQGTFQIEWDLLGRVLTLPNGMNYYGDDAFEEERVVAMVQEILTAVDASVDFSKYHTVFIIHAGAGQETDSNNNSRGQLWSSFYDLDDIERAYPDSSISGLATNDLAGGEPFFVDNFIIAPANPSQDTNANGEGIIIGSLGIWAFEIGSRVGLLPLSDSTPRGYPDSRGAGYFCLMSYGLYSALSFVPSFPCTFNRILAGWIEPFEVTGDGTFLLRDINSLVPVDTACLKIPINESEYYLVVNRVHDTNFDSLFTFVNLDTACFTPDNVDSLGGAEFDYFLTDQTNPFTIGIDPNCPDGGKRFVITGSGIYIWHIDERIILENLAAGYLPNDFVNHKGVDLEEADGIQDLDYAGGAITLGGYFDSYRVGNNTLFGPGTDPSSTAYSGAETGISIEIGSEPASIMQCSVRFSSPYAGTVTTWPAAGAGQPPVPVDCNGDNRKEIMVLADSAGVFIFNSAGAEFYDWDVDPATIEPYIPVSDVAWAGPAAFGDIDDQLGGNIVAAAKNGTLYAWHGDGGDVFDGDGNPATIGVLGTGDPIVAPPLLADVDGDGNDDIAIARIRSDSLIVSFVNWQGETVVPYNAEFASLWPVKLQAQACAPLAYGYCGNSASHTGGIVISWADTLNGKSGVAYMPVVQQPSPFTDRQSPDMIAGGASQRVSAWNIELNRGEVTDAKLLTLLPPVVGDLDLDGFDEVVLVLPEGRLVVHDNSPFDGQDATIVTALKATAPSAPSLGDIDRNGTLEIVLFDSEYFYIFAGNGGPLTDWPRPRSVRLGIERPPAPDDLFGAAPLIGDIDGDERTEVLFTGYDGAAYAFRGNGDLVPDFPRVVPSGVTVTPALVDFENTGDVTFVVGGHVTSLHYRDAVADTFVTENIMSLALQDLPGTVAGQLFWSSDRNGGRRWGRTVSGITPPVKNSLVEDNSCILYPNPVLSASVNIRMIINKAGALGLVIYNLEGEDALTRDFGTVNPGGLADYIVDERVDVSALASGLYFARISIRGSGASEVIVKPFAVKR